MASKSLLSVDTQRPLSVNLAKLPIQNRKKLKSATVKCAKLWAFFATDLAISVHLASVSVGLA